MRYPAFVILSINLLISFCSPQITVLEPASLSKLINIQGMPHSSIPYNISMFGEIHYSQFQNLEVLLPDIGNLFGCEELYTPKLSKKQQFAFILKRGKCPFSKKAHNAKLVGAAMVFIYFDHEVDYTSFMNYFLYAPYFKENMIPAVLLDHDASHKIKNVLSTEKKVILKVALQVENERHEIADVEFVLGVNNLQSYNLLSQIGDFTRSLGFKIKFRPVYYFKKLKLEEFKTVNGISKEEQMSQHCFNGKYCLHHEEQTSQFKLEEYFKEGLRQICLWEHCDQKIQWWKYVDHYRTYCLNSRTHGNLRQCFEAAMKNVKLTAMVSTIDECVEKSRVKDQNDKIIDNSCTFVFTNIYSFFI